MSYNSSMPSLAHADARLPHAALTLTLSERGLLPEMLTRAAMRIHCAHHLRDERAGGPEVVWQRFQILLDSLRQSPIDGRLRMRRASREDTFPPRLFELTLGPRMLHSSAYFGKDTPDLAGAEEAMLDLCAERAQLTDGQSILELGSGWGAWTLWMAERFPSAKITAVCDTPAQAQHLRSRCASRRFTHVNVVQEAIDKLTLVDTDFDRVVSIGMFEHMRNYSTLLNRIAGWLRPGGTLFVHMLCHRELMYTLENNEQVHWLGDHFCAERLIAAASTLLYFQQHLILERHWLMPGSHHERTINAWLERQRSHRAELVELFAREYGQREAMRHYRSYRLALMGQSEMFGYADGGEWMLTHYRFMKR